MAQKRGNPVERFMSKFKVGDGCWEWGGTKAGKGYGMIQFGGHAQATRVYAHRFSYELFKGPIPEGLCVDHLCRNRLCVRPSHLEAVTIGENSRRGEIRWNNGNLAKTHCKRGHPFSPENTRTPAGTNFRVCRKCSNLREAKYRALRRGSINGSS